MTLYKKGSRHLIFIHLFFILVSLAFILPLLLVVSISLSDESYVTNMAYGYSLLPRGFTLIAYQTAFANTRQIVTAYLVTSSQAVLGTVLSCLVLGMVAYPLSRSNFAFKGIVTFIVFFTMLFNAGLIPTYVVYANTFGFLDNYWVYILPGLAGGAWYTLLVRTFFKQIPESLFESAKIDGAREITCFFRIAAPLSKPVFATVGFMMLKAKWNDWMTSLIYIRNPDLYTLQYLLQRIISELEFIKGLMARPPAGIDTQVLTNYKLPAETVRYAVCVIAAGPMLIVFPLFQKYLVKGLTVGAVKG